MEPASAGVRTHHHECPASSPILRRGGAKLAWLAHQQGSGKKNKKPLYGIVKTPKNPKNPKKPKKTKKTQRSPYKEL